MKRILFVGCFCLGALFLSAPPVVAQNSTPGGKSAVQPSESIRSQVERIELSAKKTMGASSEVLTELNKDLSSGLTALKGAAVKLDSAIGRLKSDSAFLQDCARCADQLQRQKRDIEALQGNNFGEEVQLLMAKAHELETRLEQAKRVAATSLNVMEATKGKIETWQKVYSQFEAVVGKEEAVSKIRQKVATEIGNVPKPN